MTMAEAMLMEHSWITKHITYRMSQLLLVVNGQCASRNCSLEYSQHSLTVLGNWFDQHIATRSPTTNELDAVRETISPLFRKFYQAGPWPTEMTLSCCIDIGIYLAECVRNGRAGLFWTYHTHAESASEYQNLILTGFDMNIIYEPSRIGWALAIKSLKGVAAASELKRLWKFWLAEP